MRDYDLIVIGAGAAGSSCAEKLNEAGQRVALIERDALGGTCLNYGCDPTKTALYSAQILYRAQQSQRYGLDIPTATEDWWWLQERLKNVQEKMRGGNEEEARQQLRERGIALFMGEATFVSDHEVSVNGRVLTGDHILIATGMETAVPEIPGLIQSGFVTNRNIFELPLQPQNLAIMGAGPVGVEFAQLFARLGTKVHLFEADAHILPQDDPELAAELEAILAEEGVEVKTQARITAVMPSGSGKKLTVCYDNGYQEEVIVSELLIAAGRQPVFDSLNLEVAGVTLKDVHIATDASLRTQVPHIWAAGDVTNDYPFTHVAWRQGEHVAQNIMAGEARPFLPGPIPWVTYTDPELAHVGQTEAQLKEAGTAYRVISQPLAEVARAIISGQTNGRVKLLIDDNDQILGGHILAAHGGELLGPVLLAMQAGIPATQLAQVVWPYPTLSTIWEKTSRNGETS